MKTKDTRYRGAIISHIDPSIPGYVCLPAWNDPKLYDEEDRITVGYYYKFDDEPTSRRPYGPHRTVADAKKMIDKDLS
jgi:hypothetical protein